MAPVISEHSFSEMMNSFSKLSDERLGQLMKQGKEFVPQSVAETVARGYWNSAVIHMTHSPQPASNAAQPESVKVSGNFFHDMDIRPVEPKPVKDPLTRTDLFVKDMNIYILDGVQRQTGHKLAAFRLSIGKIVKEAIDSMNEDSQDEFMAALILENGGRVKNNPCIKIYVNCPDSQIDVRANNILENLAMAKRHGIELDIKIIGNSDAAWARVLPNIERYVPAPQITNMMERQSQK